MTIDERLERLERQNRWLRSGLGLLVVVVLAGGLLGLAGQDDTVPDIVKARAFHAVDEDGNVLVKVGGRTVYGTTCGSIDTMTSEAQKLVSIDTTAATASNDSAQRMVGAINTFHHEGQPLVSIGVDVGGPDDVTVGGIKILSGARAGPVVSIGCTPDGGGSLVAFGKVKGEQGGAIASVGVFRGAGLIMTSGPKPGAMVRLGASKNGDACISAWGRVSPSVAQPLVVISSKDGTGIVGVHDSSGQNELANLLVPMTGPPTASWQPFWKGTPQEQSE
jgi:hypothetical protein